MNDNIIAAAGGLPPGSDGIRNPALGDTLDNLLIGEGGVGFLQRMIQVGITIVLIVGSLYFIFQLLTGGVDWIRAGADKASLEQARGKLMSAVIGLVVLFSAWAVFNLINSVFGVNLLLFNIPSLGV